MPNLLPVKTVVQVEKNLGMIGKHLGHKSSASTDRYPQDTDNYTNFAISALSRDIKNNKLCLKRIENYQND